MEQRLRYRGLHPWLPRRSPAGGKQAQKSTADGESHPARSKSAHSPPSLTNPAVISAASLRTVNDGSQHQAALAFPPA